MDYIFFLSMGTSNVNNRAFRETFRGGQKCVGPLESSLEYAPLKVHKNENLFGFDFEFCTISMLVMHK